MRKNIFFVLFLFFIFSLNLNFVKSIGISPSYISIFFEPNLKKSIDFYVIGLKPGTKLELYVKYENENLRDIVKLSEPVFLGEGKYKFTAYINLPSSKENLSPGKNVILIGAKETSIAQDKIIALTAVQIPIVIYVLHEGDYIEAKLETMDIAINETAKFKVKIMNLGTTNLTVDLFLEIYYGDKKIASMPLGKTTINSKEEKIIYGEWNSEGYKEGTYKAKIIIKYGNKTAEHEKEFKIGSIKIEIIDFKKEFNVDSIEKFYLEIENKWNKKIENVYAEIEIFSKEKKVMSFKTPNFDINGLERKIIETYVNTEGIKPGIYQMEINLYYANYTSRASSEVIFREEINKTLVIIIVIIILIIIGFLIRWLLKKRKRKKLEERELKLKKEKKIKKRR